MFHSTQKSPVAYYFIYPCMRTCVDLKQHFIQYYCPCTWDEARSGIFDHKFMVQTFYACFIPSRKVLLHIILFILACVRVST